MDKIELDGREVKVGDRLYSLLHGWVTVELIRDVSHIYRLFLKIDTGSTVSFTAEGLFNIGHVTRTLYWDVPVVSTPKPPKRMVMVSDWVIFEWSGDVRKVVIGLSANRLCEIFSDWENQYEEETYFARKICGTERMVDEL